MEHWIEYEKNNKEKINKADELINIQEIILLEYKRVLKENEELMGDSTLKDRTINQINNQLKEKDEIIEKQIKAIDKMARRLTTEYHDKEWVISYYMGE